VLRSRAGLRAVTLSLLLLMVTAAGQAAVYVLTGSVALVADLIHNAGDALTAVPVGAAFLLRSVRAERWAGYLVVLAILVSACFAFWQAVEHLLHPEELTYLGPLAAAGALGYVGNELAARVRLRAGLRLQSPALIADGHHARVDGLVSLGVVLSRWWSRSAPKSPIRSSVSQLRSSSSGSRGNRGAPCAATEAEAASDGGFQWTARQPSRRRVSTPPTGSVLRDE
jgi:Co/Zn/Cd efflux system component